MNSHLSRRRFLTGTSAVLAASWSHLASRDAWAQLSDATVETASGRVRGTVNRGIHAFKGIPYGASTAGAQRFMAPAPPTPWRGVREATTFGPWSPQNMRFTEVLAPQGDLATETASEDCLVLNVWTPRINSAARRPVMFWCHGGGFAQESASWPWVDGEALARRGDVVVVTINHRLNVVGYLHLGDIAGEKYAAAGNAGMLDLVAGLRWVRDNIAQFGGNPEQVTIFGESGGGRKVCTLMAMPAARGLFHRAVVQSSAQLRSVTRDQGTAAARALLDVLQITPAQIDRIQAIPIERIVSAQVEALRRLGPAASPAMGFAPVMDGSHLPTHPFDPIASPLSAEIPLIIGTNTHEATLAAAGDLSAFAMSEHDMLQRVTRIAGANAARVIETYRQVHPNAAPSDLYFRIASEYDRKIDAIQVAERKHAQGQAPVYMYTFDWRSPALGGRLGATHTVEIPFVFDNTHIPTTMTTGGPEVKELAGRTSDAWVAFARNGNPNHQGLPEWPAYTPATRATMIFNTTCRVANDPGRAERELWTAIRAGS